MANNKDHDAQYFSFPLSFLAINKDIKEKMLMILIFGLANTYFDEKECRYIDKKRSINNDQEFLKTNEVDRNNMMNILHTLGYFKVRLEKATEQAEFYRLYEEAHKFYREYVNEYGPDAFVQMHINICIKTLKESIKYELFSLVCAVKSIIGKTAYYKRITLRNINCRMNGYKSMAILEDIEFKSELNSCYKNYTIPSLLSDNKIRYLRNKARKLNFFFCTTLSRRCTYYSTRISDEITLQKAIVNKNKKKSKKEENEDDYLPY